MTLARSSSGRHPVVITRRLAGCAQVVVNCELHCAIRRAVHLVAIVSIHLSSRMHALRRACSSPALRHSTRSCKRAVTVRAMSDIKL